MTEQKPVVPFHCGQIIVKDSQTEIISSPNIQRKVFVGYHNNYVHVFETLDEFPVNCHHPLPEFMRHSTVEYHQPYESTNGRHNIEERLERSNYCDFSRETMENSRIFSSIPQSTPPLLLNCQHFPPCMVFRGAYSTYGCANPYAILDPDGNVNLQFVGSASHILPITSNSELLPPEVQLQRRVGHFQHFEVQNFSHSSVHLQYTPLHTDGENHFRYVPTTVPSEIPTLCIPAQNTIQTQFGPIHAYPGNVHLTLEDNAQRNLVLENRVVNENTTTHICSTEQRNIQTSDNDDTGGHFNNSIANAQIFQGIKNISSFSYIDQNNVGNPVMFPNYSYTARPPLNSGNTDDDHIVEMVTEKHEFKDPKLSLFENDFNIEQAKDVDFNEIIENNLAGYKTYIPFKNPQTLVTDSNMKDPDIPNIKLIGEQKESTMVESVIVPECDNQSTNFGVNKEIIDVKPLKDTLHSINVRKELVAEKNNVNRNNQEFYEHATHDQLQYPQMCDYRISSQENYFSQSEQEEKDSSVFGKNPGFDQVELATQNPHEQEFDSLIPIRPKGNQEINQNFETLCRENASNVNVFLKYHCDQTPGNPCRDAQPDSTGRQIPGIDLSQVDRFSLYKPQSESEFDRPHQIPISKTTAQESESEHEIHPADALKDYQVPYWMAQEDAQMRSAGAPPHSDQCLESVIQTFDRALTINGSENRPHNSSCRGPYCYFCFQQLIKYHQISRLQREELLCDSSNYYNNLERMRLLNIPIGNILLTGLLMWCFRLSFVKRKVLQEDN